jgi:hypothetical protein
VPILGWFGLVFEISSGGIGKFKYDVNTNEFKNTDIVGKIKNAFVCVKYVLYQFW